MKRSKRIQQLKKLLDRDLESEAIKLAQYKVQITTEERKLEQLQEFRGDYLGQRTRKGSMMYPDQLRDIEKLKKQLDFSIAQQQKHISLLVQQLELQREKWLALHNKVKAYAGWIEKLCLEEQTITARQEQKLLDEFSTNRNIKE